MNEFNTKLIELLEKICEYIPANKPDERAVQLFNELKEMNKQEIEQEEQTSIDELDLSVRSKNLLLCGGVKTIGDLENATFDYIVHCRNMGLKSTREIYTKLIEWKEKQKGIKK